MHDKFIVFICHTFFWSGDSNMKVTASASSWAFIVSIVSLLAHFKIFVILAIFIPIDKLRSQRNLSNPSECRFNETNDTWELSMVCTCNEKLLNWRTKTSQNYRCNTRMPEFLHSKIAVSSKSLMASRTFFKTFDGIRRASNMIIIIILRFHVLKCTKFQQNSVNILKNMNKLRWENLQKTNKKFK